MATSTLTVSSAFTTTSGLQPDQSTPISVPILADTQPNYVVQSYMTIPGDQKLPIPSTWTTVTSVQITNLDPTNYIQIIFTGTSGVGAFMCLPPNGGTLAINSAGSFSSYRSGGLGMLNGAYFMDCSNWTLYSISGGGGGVTACLAYVFIAGY